MMNNMENQKLSNEQLEDVTGGGIISDLLESIKKRKKRNIQQGEEFMGQYHCLSCGYLFSWAVDTAPVCKCGERYNLKRIGDLNN